MRGSWLGCSHLGCGLTSTHWSVQLKNSCDSKIILIVAQLCLAQKMAQLQQDGERYKDQQ